MFLFISVKKKKNKLIMEEKIKFYFGKILQTETDNRLYTKINKPLQNVI